MVGGNYGIGMACKKHNVVAKFRENQSACLVVKGGEDTQTQRSW
jgi:hypothetical protein